MRGIKSENARLKRLLAEKALENEAVSPRPSCQRHLFIS